MAQTNLYNRRAFVPASFSHCFVCVHGANTQIFDMDNSQCIVRLSHTASVVVWNHTKTESTCLVGQMNTGDQVNEQKGRERENAHTHMHALVHELMDVLLSHSQCAVGKPNNHPIFSSNTHSHTCKPYGVSRAPFVLTI